MSETNNGKDRVTLGTTVRGKAVLDQLVERPDLFNTEASAFKSLVTLAIRLDLDPSTATSFTTKWNAGSLSDLLDFVSWYKETDTPARLSERLADAALSHIETKVRMGASITDIFELQEDVSV